MLPFTLLCFLTFAKTMGSSGDLFAYQEPATCRAAFLAAEKAKWKKDAVPEECPLTSKIVYWQRLLSPSFKVTRENFEEVLQFLQANPYWPQRNAIQKKAESILDEDFLEPAVLMEWFSKTPPLTVEGTRAYVRALLVSGQAKKAQLVVRNKWVEGTFTIAQARKFYDEFNEMISEVDTRSRVDCLLAREKVEEAQAMFPFLDENYRKLAEARISLIKRSPDVQKRLAAVPGFLQKHPGLTFERIRYLRVTEEPDPLDRILQLFSTVTPEQQQLYPDQWWKERNIIARQLLFKRRYKDAYFLTSNHCLTEGEDYATAEWFSAWIETRFLGNPQGGLLRFKRLYKKVKTPISKSRVGYWAGMAAEQLGMQKEARAWFEKAKQHPATYYGQLAQGKLGKMEHPEVQPMPIVLENSPDVERMMRVFDNRELVKVIALLHSFQHFRLMDLFFNELSKVIMNPTEQLLLIDLAQGKGSTYLGVDTAIKSSKDIVHVLRESYPTLPFVEKISVLDPALLHAIIRRESRFNPSVASGAGATGLMQVRPATAKEIARRHKIPFSSLTNPQQNVRIGATYVSSLLQQYDYCLVLTLAAYNAGPTPVKRWIQDYGDPRTSIDPSDWVEHIPYHETRNYVQRVLENYMIYRSRFEQEPLTLQSLMQDYRNVIAVEE